MILLKRICFFTVILLAVGSLAFAGAPPAGNVDKEDLPPGISGGWLTTVQQNILKEEYNLSRAEGKNDALYHAPNRAQGFRSLFSEKGVSLVPRTDGSPAWEWGLEFVSKSEGGSEKAEVTAAGNRIEIDRGYIKEWYVNDEKGLEQGFTVLKPIDKSGKLHIDMKLTGGLHPKFAEDGQAVDFYGNGNLSVLTYSKLKATDAGGTVLPSWFEGINGGIRIAVDDRGARYPVTIDPLATTPAWTAMGDQYGAILGESVGTAGDVNGDGYTDVIVGAPQYQNETSQGLAFLYYGSASGLNTTPVILETNQYGQFGGSVSTAGDINGDGYSDVIVGAAWYDNGEENEGAAYVYYGSASGLNTTPLILESNREYAHLGSSVATAGDINGDGYSDIVVGADEYDNGEDYEGAAFVYYGSASGLNTTPLILELNQVIAQFGWSVATAGDINGDGYGDVIVGVLGFDNGETNEGAAFVYYGSASGLNTTPLILETNQAGAVFGISVATAGDVNGDGYSDVIVGAIGYDNGETDEGAAFVYHGSVTGLATTPLILESNQADAGLGYSVATAGDINGDGYSDVIVGAVDYDNGETDEGAAFVYYGSASGLNTAHLIVDADQAEADFGHSVATAGDVNGDGYSDVIVGAIWYDTTVDAAGAAFVYCGSAAGPASAAGWNAAGILEEEYFGVSVSRAGDVNGDGYGDVIVGAYLYDNGEADEGRALIYLGSASGLSAAAAWSGEGNQAGAHFGLCVSAAGDVNGDGYGDVIIGADSYSNGEAYEGAAFVYHGSASGLNATPLVLESNQVSAYFGYSVGTAGDVNGDGYGDVVVGAPYFDNGQTDEGRAFVYHGSASGLSAAANWTAESNQASAYFGNSVSGAGDVNGDGYSDVIIGADSYDNGQTNEGLAFVYHGSVSGLSASYSWVGEVNQASAYFGVSVSAAGDVNGDGYSDVIVGAYSYDNGQTNEGAAFVYHGSATGLASAVSWYEESDQASSSYGISVGTAGDVNGDGYSDVIVGANNHYYYNEYEGRAFVYAGSASGLGSTAAWTADGGVYEAGLGGSVSAAGDVNGDGYGDIIVGASMYTENEAYEGRAFLYYGNGGLCLTITPRQLRSDGSAPVAPLGRAEEGLFGIAALGRTPFGRGDVKLEWQVAPLGGSFNFSLNPAQAQYNWTDSGTAGASLSRSLLLADGNGPYIWRMRTRYNAASSPFQGHGPWLTLAENGLRETDIRRTAGSTGCVEPDEPCWIYFVTTDGTNHTLNWQDPNQENQRTGWNVRRSDDPSVVPKSSWPIVCSNCVDMDQITGNYQWTDTSGDIPGSGVWYYLVTAYNAYCPAEGPFSSE